MDRNRIAYIDGDWTGELFAESGLIILKGTEVMFFKMRGRTINTYEELADLMKDIIRIDKMREAKKAMKKD